MGSGVVWGSSLRLTQQCFGVCAHVVQKTVGRQMSASVDGLAGVGGAVECIRGRARGRRARID